MLPDVLLFDSQSDGSIALYKSRFQLKHYVQLKRKATYIFNELNEPSL